MLYADSSMPTEIFAQGSADTAVSFKLLCEAVASIILQGLEHQGLDQGHVILDHAALEQAHQAQQAMEHQGLTSLSGLEHVTHQGLEHQVGSPLCQDCPGKSV